MDETSGLPLERLHKVLARAGLCARRECERWILAGRVAVNGTVVTSLGTKVGPDDVITVDGRPINRAVPRAYFLLDKPRGYVSTVRDPQGRPTVVDLVRSPVRVYPVGRLDYDSEGLMLLTNDGELANRLLHPRYELEKEYQVLVRPVPTPEQLRQLRAGVTIGGRPTLPAEVRVTRRQDDSAWLQVILREGRKRQIRLMCRAVGLQVVRLIRVRIGPLTLGNLRPGEFRALTAEEVDRLRRAAGLGG